MSNTRTLSVLGSINVDLVVRAKTLPAPGETVHGGELERSFGGKGANQAVAAARMGAGVRFFGCVGDDENGRAARANLVQHGIDVRGVRSVKRATGVALIVIDARGQNQIAVAPGANELASASGAHDMLLTQLETPWERVQARTLILNLAPARKISLRGVDVVILNELEAEFVTGCKQPAKAALALERLGAGRAIVTLGERGVFDGKLRPALRVRAIDTVGAGDAFCGAFAAALAAGHEDPVLFAQVVAALKVQRRGAQNLPTREEVARRLARRRS